MDAMGVGHRLLDPSDRAPRYPGFRPPLPCPPYGCFPGRPGLRPRRAKSTAMRRRNGAVVAATAWHRSSWTFTEISGVWLSGSSRDIYPIEALFPLTKCILLLNWSPCDPPSWARPPRFPCWSR